MKEIEQFVKAWNIIKDGSLQCTLHQDQDLINVHITPDKVTIDIMDPYGLELASPFIKRYLERRMSTMDHIVGKGSITLGLLGTLRDKKGDLTKYMAFVQELANTLAEHNKALVLAEKGKQVAKIGQGAESLGMRLLSLHHVEVNDLPALWRLKEKVKSL